MPSALGTKSGRWQECVCVCACVYACLRECVSCVMLDILDAHIDKIESICTFRYTNFQMQTNACKQTHTHKPRHFDRSRPCVTAVSSSARAAIQKALSSNQIVCQCVCVLFLSFLSDTTGVVCFTGHYIV